MPTTAAYFPPFATGRIGRNSGLLFHWRARDGLLLPLTNQSATLVRAGVAGKVPALGGKIGGVVHTQPNWGMRDDDLDGIREKAALAMFDGYTNQWGAEAEAMGDAAWTRTGVSVVANTYPAPDTAMTMDAVMETAVTSNHSVERNATGLTDNVKQTLQCYVRGGLGRTWIRIRLVNKAGTAANAWFNLSTGLWGTVHASIEVFSELLEDGKYLLAATYDVSAGATTPSGGVFFATADNSTATYLGVITIGAYVWGLSWHNDTDGPRAYQNFNTLSVADVLRWTIAFDPPDFGIDWTLLVDYEPHWARTGKARTAYRMCAIGGAGAFAADGFSALDMFRDNVLGNLRARYALGAVAFEPNAIAIPASGLVKHLVQLRANAQNHDIYHEVNGAGGQLLAGGQLARTTWRTSTLAMNEGANGAQPGAGMYREIILAQGRYSLAEIEAMV